MSGCLDEGCHQHRAVAVASQPIVGQLPLNEREDFGGQTLGLDPGQNQKAGIVHHEWQLPLPLFLVPADEALTRGELPSAGAEAQQGDQVLAGEDEVATLAAGHGRVAEIVVAGDVLVPQPGMGRTDDLAQAQRR